MNERIGLIALLLFMGCTPLGWPLVLALWREWRRQRG